MGLRVREAQDGADGPGSGHHRAQPVPQVRGAVAADLLLEAAGHFLQGTNAGTDGEGECRGALAQAGSPQHAQHSKPPVSLLGQLYWREFFYLNGHTVPNFDRMEGNPICKQIPWRKDGDAETERLLEAWEEGRTGYPFIDAIMVGPATWGVGGVHAPPALTAVCPADPAARGGLDAPPGSPRGGLLPHAGGPLDFVGARGARVRPPPPRRRLVHQQWQLDVAQCLGFLLPGGPRAGPRCARPRRLTRSPAQFFRVYSPVAFGKKTDKEGAFIRHYLPVLARMPAKYIYEPWKAPLAVQREAGCVVGEDYPAPVVDHAVVSKENIAKMKEAYAAARSGKKGADATRKRARTEA